MGIRTQRLPVWQKQSNDDEAHLQTLCKQGQLDKALDYLFHMNSSPSDNTYMYLLQACSKNKAPIEAKWVHAHLAHHRTHFNGFLGSYLVMTLAKCGAIVDAYCMSESLPSRTVFTWTALVFAYAECGQGQEALSMYQHMLEDNVKPNSYTFVSLFKACGTIPDLIKGKELHALADRLGFLFDNVHVGTSLLSMYEKCGAIDEAEQVFAALSERNVVSWNVMLSAYVEQCQGEKALKLYRQMQMDGISADNRTLLFAIQACGILALQFEVEVLEGESAKAASLNIGKALHGLARAKGFTSDICIATALLRMYGMCGAIVEAEYVFAALSHIDTVSWTAMIAMYVEQGQGERAIGLYIQMQAEHATVDDVTLICILQACNNRGCLEVCKKLHFDISSAGCDESSGVTATLIDAYGNCGSMVDAQAIFDKHPVPDIVVWNACIAGYAGQENTAASLQLFEKLKREGIKPDEVTFLVILTACNHSGLVVKGLQYFESMTRDYGLNPGLKHYGTMVYLLGNGGEFNRLERMLMTMPIQADLTIWLCLLDVCGEHGNLQLAKQAFDRAVNLQPNHATAYTMMSKIYADAGLFECAAEVEYSRKNRGSFHPSRAVTRDRDCAAEVENSSGLCG